MSDTTPLCITGLSARVPGAPGLSGMWDSLSNGLCTIAPIRATLFDPARYYDPQTGRRGKSYTFSAGQLDRLYHFDAAFFGIPPRTAAQMDPQQRLMLRSVWEAVEDSGLRIADLAGDRTGVFVGTSIVENLALYYYDPARAGSQFPLGNTLSVVANRVSAIFDFRGPSHAVDTACASGLYALSQAADALRAGQIDTAIVGSVHCFRTPGGFVGFSQARMMSPTGLCRAFDAAADGYVRTEASVAVVLQRAETAARMGARVRARLLASRVNSDGQTSEITIPSGVQQEALIDSLLQTAGMDPEDLHFYEAHGTGTAVGDPIEAGSLGRAIGRLRRDPLLIGSAKTNFGHAEPAAGLVGLSKVLLAFEHRALPASLHFTTPNPAIDFEDLNLEVNTALRPLPHGVLRAGLNAFGFGGTNVGALVESVDDHQRRLHPVGGAVPDPAATDATTAPGSWLLLSAASMPALRSRAGQWAERLTAADPAEAAGLIAAQGASTAFAERLALPVGPGLIAGLQAFAAGAGSGAWLRGTATMARPLTVFAFPGNGVQVPGMGARDHALDPDFATAFDAVAAGILAGGGPDCHALMQDPAPDFDSPLVAQPLLFAWQIARARSLMARGLQPGALVGHSVGEIAALHLAGCFDLAAAIHIILTRSRAFETLRGQGGMAVVAAAEPEVAQVLAGLGHPGLAIAAVNAPRSVTVAGPEDALAALARTSLNGRRLPMVRLKVAIPYHSPAVDPLEQRFRDELAGIRFHAPRIPVAGSALGRLLGPREVNVEYLWRNARATVRFADALGALARKGALMGVEIAPVSALAGNFRDIARQDGLPMGHLEARLPGDPAPGDPLGAPGPVSRMLAQGWVEGLDLSPEALAGPRAPVPPRLPPYPFDEQVHHTELSPDGLDAWGEMSPRRMVGLRADRASWVWTADFTPTAPAWAADHQVGGAPVLPAAALAEMVLGAGRDLFPTGAFGFRDFDILAPARLEGEGLRLRSTLDPEGGRLTLDQRPRLTEAAWGILARADLVQEDLPPAPRPLRPRGTEMDLTGLYERLADLGLTYGPRFRRLETLRRAGRDTLWAGLSAAVDMPPGLLDVTGLDAAFHGFAALMLAGLSDAELRAAGDRVLVPVRIGRLVLLRDGAELRLARLQIIRRRRQSLSADLQLMDAAGVVVAQLSGVEFAAMRISAGAAPVLRQTVRRWQRLALPGAPVALPAVWARPARQLRRLGWQPLDPAAPPQPLAAALMDLRRQLATEAAAESDPVSPDLAAAVAAVLDLNMDLAADVRALIREGRGAVPGMVAQQGLAHRRLQAAVQALVQRLAAGWPGSERLNVLILGLPHSGLLRGLGQMPGVDRVGIADPRPGMGPHLARALPVDLLPCLVGEGPAEAGAWDVIIAAGLRPDGPDQDPRLRPGGLMLALDLAGAATPPDWATGAWRLPDPQLDLHLALARRGPKDAAPETSDPAPAPVLLDVVPGDDPLAQLMAVLAGMRDWAADPGRPRVLLLRGQGGAGPGSAVLAAGLGSAMRSFANEHPEAQIGLVILSGDQDPAPARLESLSRLALQHLVVRLQGERIETEVFAPLPALPPGVTPGRDGLALDQSRPGDFTALFWQPLRRTRPGPGMVEIEVEATGLNFRDVMLARGLLPERLLDLGASGHAFGLECAGIVRRVGAGVSGLQPGARVLALAGGAFGRFVTVRAEALAPLPSGMAPEVGAALPVAFLTAAHALDRVARLRAGDSVLIHGGAGGVGLAAIQIARRIGARVFATAGSSDKVALAMAMGAEAVFNSRDLSFGPAVRAATGGRGVDVVLNSLAGPAMHESLRCLAPFGRFIELGKRDFLEGSRIDLRPFLENLSYHGVDLDQVVALDPAAARARLTDLVAALERGEMRPLPVLPHDADLVDEAFATMFAARHSGKITVRPPAVVARAPRLRPVQDTWILLGGTGGIGLAVARSLRRAGASRVVLVSRSGDIALHDLAGQQMVAGDPGLAIVALDAADPQALADLLAAETRGGARIGGVIHAAMVLRDRRIAELDPAELGHVLRNKLGVALALHQALEQQPEQPDHVIFFSSIVAQIGNVGQLAYGAANAALEGLAEARRAAGRPARVLGWGPVADAGYLERDRVTATRLARSQGIALMPVADLCAALLAAIEDPRAASLPDRVLAAVDWPALADLLPVLDRPAFARLVPANRSRRMGSGDLRARLKQLGREPALALVRDEIREILSGIMRMPAGQFDMNLPLTRHGIDSLMAMELRLHVEQRLGASLPAAALSRDITGARLAVLLLERLQDEGDSPVSAPV